MRGDCIFFHPIHVRYGEVDQQGVVYNANYGIYTDSAFEAFLRSKGYTYKALVKEHESEVCHKKSTYEYSSSAYADDDLEIGVRVIRVGNRSFTLGFEVYRKDEEDMLAKAEIVYVGYDTENRSSRPITKLMREILGAD
ncbi:thioesterase family protein [Bacillota bacterium]